MPIRYIFNDDAAATAKLNNRDQLKERSQEIGEALAKLGPQRRIPAVIVEEARSNRDSPLRLAFEWDVQNAAYSYWLEQARALCQCINVTDEFHADPVPAFTSVPSEDGRRYFTHLEVLESGALQIAILKREERELQNWIKRNQRLAEICPIVEDAMLRLRRHIGNQEAAMPPPRPRPSA